MFHHANRTSSEGAQVYVMDFGGKFTRIDVPGATVRRSPAVSER